jgi:uncharacterized protein YndB with AHSA1/START domain
MTTTVRPEPIKLSVETPAEPDLAWQAITDPDRIAEWFTDATPLGAPGAEYRLDFGDSAVAGVVVEVESGRRFSYTWAWEAADGDEETLVTWTVDPLASGGSRILLEHSGWPATTPDDTARDDHLGYWEAYLEDLAALLAG